MLVRIGLALCRRAAWCLFLLGGIGAQGVIDWGFSAQRDRRWKIKSKYPERRALPESLRCPSTQVAEQFQCPVPLPFPPFFNVESTASYPATRSDKENPARLNIEEGGKGGRDWALELFWNLG